MFGFSKKIKNIDDNIKTNDENTNQFASCITDKPLSKRQQDKLNASDYADGLHRFIISAETPITIGIQGAWGSGKTSLISMLGEKLNEDTDHQALCVFVNAWEHALFQATENKADVALSLLNGLYEGLRTSIENTGWLDKSKSDDALKKNEEIIHKAFSALKLALNVGLAFATSTMYAGRAATEKSVSMEKVPSVATTVHNLREALNDTVKILTKSGKPDKIVFFIDDLDRVPPATAIEILDITKNIFDVDNCIFVLAIDYDVVVKGLKGKYGQKTEENEREFRQYFDKIIQIPFTMPIGAYSNYIKQMIETSLLKLNYPLKDETGSISEKHKKLIERLSNEAIWATGGVPRSIKRILNTLSLLQHISISESGEEEQDEIINQNRLDELEIRFIIVALQIDFPEICRAIMRKSNFLQWNFDDLTVKWKLDRKSAHDDIESLKKDLLFDEEWEQVLYCLCQKSTWLKSQVRNISDLLNNLRNALGAKERKQIDEDKLSNFIGILDSIRIVSVDTESSNQIIDDSNMKNDSISVFCKNMHKALAKKIDIICDYDANENLFATGHGLRGRRTYDVEINEDEFFSDIFIEWSGQRGEEKNLLFIGFDVYEPDKGKIKFKKALKELADEEKNIFVHDYQIMLAYDIVYNDFKELCSNYEKFIENTVDLYKQLLTVKKHFQVS